MAEVAEVATRARTRRGLLRRQSLPPSSMRTMTIPARKTDIAKSEERKRMEERDGFAAASNRWWREIGSSWISRLKKTRAAATSTRQIGWEKRKRVKEATDSSNSKTERFQPARPPPPPPLFPVRLRLSIFPHSFLSFFSRFACSTDVTFDVLFLCLCILRSSYTPRVRGCVRVAKLLPPLPLRAGWPLHLSRNSKLRELAFCRAYLVLQLTNNRIRNTVRTTSAASYERWMTRMRVLRVD